MPPKKVRSARKAAPKGGHGQRKQLTFAESMKDQASKAVHTTRHVRFSNAATPVKKAAPPRQGSGIVTAASVRKAGKRQRDEDEAHRDDVSENDEAASLVDDSNSSQEDYLSGQDSDDDLSDLADGERSSDEADVDIAGEDAFARAKRTGSKLSYQALRLRFLPSEFQEPQLFKFLGQFGAEVLNCFCVRSRRTHQSKGIAYVQFDRVDVLPLVLEECNGMALGGRAVRARVVTLHRPMPSKEKVTKRRQLAYAYKTKGAPLKQHTVLRKSPVALLIKASRTEAGTNAYLETLGIDFHTEFFVEQLRTVPPHLITRNTKVLVDARAVVNGHAGVATATSPQQPAARSPSPKKAASPSPPKPAATPSKPSEAGVSPVKAAPAKPAPAKKAPAKAAPAKKAPAKKAPAKKAPAKKAPAKKAVAEGKSAVKPPARNGSKKEPASRRGRNTK